MRIAEDQRRLAERADEVLARRKIDRRLSADGGIDLRQKCRRNLHEADPAQIRRSREARHVAGYAAAQRDDKPFSGNVPRGKGVQNLGVDREVFGLLAMREGKACYVEACVLHRAQHCLAIERPHGILAYDQSLARAADLFDLLARTG